MAEIESVMARLNAHTGRLQERQASGKADDDVLLVESLALVSEALLKVGRDIRYIRNSMAEKH